MIEPGAACGTRLTLIREAELSAATAQTAGMIGAAAISGDLVGARSLWMGRRASSRSRRPGAVARLDIQPDQFAGTHREAAQSADEAAPYRSR